MDDFIEYGKELVDLSKVDAKKIVEIADDVGRRLGKRGEHCRDAIDLKVNQIRRFLDAARRIESEIKSKSFDEVKDSIILLRPKLAYAAGRESKVRPLMNVLDPAIKSGAHSRENFEKLLRLIEGIIAYHRFYGGTN